MLLLLDFSKAYTCSWLGYEHRCDPKAGENLTHAKDDVKQNPLLILDSKDAVELSARDMKGASRSAASIQKQKPPTPST